MALQIFRSPAGWAAQFNDCARCDVVTVGNFDGIHLGHQKILSSVVESARETGGIGTVVTFDPPPLKVLRPETAPPRISILRQRLDGFGALGLDAAVVLRFDLELARHSPEDFVRGILVEQLRVRAILVGENFRFGHRQAGNIQTLAELGRTHGFDVRIVPPVIFRGEVVSSTVIRREVAEGNVSHAARLLGRPFSLTGQIRAGTGTGSKLVFPTLNLAPEQELLPARGVYVTETCVEGQLHRSATNVGLRPTFNGATLSVESHLFDFSRALAAGPMEVRFWERLREEKKFSGADELRAQIAHDLERARQFFHRLDQAHGTRQNA